MHSCRLQNSSAGHLYPFQRHLLASFLSCIITAVRGILVQARSRLKSSSKSEFRWCATVCATIPINKISEREGKE